MLTSKPFCIEISASSSSKYCYWVCHERWRVGLWLSTYLISGVAIEFAWEMTDWMYDWEKALGIILWWPDLAGIYWSQFLTYWLDLKDLWMDRAIGSECIRSISGIRYKIESYEMTRPKTSARYLISKLKRI